jgi:Ca-activated chloride channel family protein
MTFIWPQMLWLLCTVPVVVAVYVMLMRRKRKAALKYASLMLIKDAAGAGQRVRRHVPPLLFLVALILMLVAIARPAAVVTLPSAHETVILAMDVSGSMRATDVKPSRLVAAQEAARAFVADHRKDHADRRRSFAATSVVQFSAQSSASSCSAAPRSAAEFSCR